MVRIRFRFSKTGAVKFTSHLDSMRMFQRCFRSAELPLCFTGGFHPHPRMSFGPSLKTSWEGLSEFLDVYMEENVPDAKGKCNHLLPAGLSIIDARVIEHSAPSLSSEITAARIRVDIKETSLNPLAVFNHEAARCGADTPGKAGIFTPEVLETALENTEGGLNLEYLTTMQGGRGLNPAEVIEMMSGQKEFNAEGMKVARTGLFTRKNGALALPQGYQAAS